MPDIRRTYEWPLARLTNNNGLTSKDIQNFLEDEEYRTHESVPMHATTPHGTYTFIITDVILREDHTLLLRLKQEEKNAG